MTHHLQVDLISALTNVEDGMIAKERGEEENLQHFEEAALRAIPTDSANHLPNFAEYEQEVITHNFEEALARLSDIAIYIQEYDDEEFTFQYTGNAVDRVIDAAEKYNV